MTDRPEKNGGKKSPRDKKRKVLISDPEPFIRDTLTIKLASRGYNILAAESGRDTVRMAVRHEPSLILMEISFKDIEGFRICQLLKGHQRTGDMPIVVLTKLEDTPERTFLFNPYVEDFITKPFSPGGVARIVDRVIREKSAKR